MGIWLPPLYGKSVEFYEKKKEKALKIMTEQQAIIDACNEEIKKLNDKKN